LLEARFPSREDAVARPLHGAIQFEASMLSQ